MDKVTKEELMKKLNLTEEEMEKVAGGTYGSESCDECDKLSRKFQTYCDLLLKQGFTEEDVDQCIRDGQRHVDMCYDECHYFG